MMKKGTSLLLSILLLIGVFSGCSPSLPQTQDAGSENVSSEEISSSSDETLGSESSAQSELTGGRTVIDHFGFEVELPEKIERVAIVWLLPLPSVLAVYQGGDVSNLVGMPPDALNAAENSILARYCPEILNVSTDFYQGGELNMEELANLEPDVVFYSGEQRAELFQNAGIPAVGFMKRQSGF